MWRVLALRQRPAELRPTEAARAHPPRLTRFGWAQQVNALEISPDKQYIAAVGNPHVRLYDANGVSPNPISQWEGHTASVTAVGFQQEGGWMYTGSEDGTVKIWDMRCEPRRAARAFVTLQPAALTAVQANGCP